MKREQLDDRVGDLLEDMGVVTHEQLSIAVAHQRRGDTRPLGALLVALGFVSEMDVQVALMRQQARRGRLAHADSLRVLDEAQESTQRVGGSFDELALAAAELGKAGSQ